MARNQSSQMKKGLKFAPVDAESEKIIQKISQSTGANAISIIHEALQVLEKSIGRQIIVRKPKSKWDLTINKYSRYESVLNFEPEN